MTDDIVCDFCGARRPAWEFPMSGGDDTGTSIGRVTVLVADPWAACDACADLIDADRFGDLLDRSMRNGPPLNLGLMSTEMISAATTAARALKAQMYAAIANQHGPRHPIRLD
jgi:hypothetical protein